MIQALCPYGNFFVTLHAQQQPRPETQDGKLHIICMGSDCIAATATGTAVQSKGGTAKACCKVLATYNIYSAQIAGNLARCNGATD